MGATPKLFLSMNQDHYDQFVEILGEPSNDVDVQICDTRTVIVVNVVGTDITRTYASVQEALEDTTLGV